MRWICFQDLRACLAVQQDSGDRGGEVSVLAAADVASEEAVSEGDAHALDIVGRRVGGDQALDEEVRDEERRVVVVEEVVQYGVHLVLGVASGALGDMHEGRRVAQAVAAAEADVCVDVAAVGVRASRAAHFEDRQLVERVAGVGHIDGHPPRLELQAGLAVAFDIITGVEHLGGMRADEEALEHLIAGRDLRRPIEHQRLQRAGDAETRVSAHLAVAWAAVSDGGIRTIRPDGAEEVGRVGLDELPARAPARAVFGAVNHRDAAVAVDLDLGAAGHVGPEVQRLVAAVGAHGLKVADVVAAALRGGKGRALAEVFVTQRGGGDGVAAGAVGAASRCRQWKILGHAVALLLLTVGHFDAVLEEGERDARWAAVLVVHAMAGRFHHLHHAHGIHVALVTVAGQALRQPPGTAPSLSGAAGGARWTPNSLTGRSATGEAATRRGRCIWRRRVLAQTDAVADVGPVQAQDGEDVPPWREDLHRVHVVLGPLAEDVLDVGVARPLLLEAREGARELHDVGIGVGLLRRAVGVVPRRAVGFELHQPDGEELHDLSSVVLVGKERATFNLQRERDGLGAVVREHVGHERIVGDFLENVSKVLQGVAHEDVVVRHEGLVVGPLVGAVDAHHEDLRQRPGHSLAKLVGGVEYHVVPHGVLRVPRGVLEGRLVQALKRHRMRLRYADGEACAQQWIVGHLARRATGLHASKVGVQRSGAHELGHLDGLHYVVQSGEVHRLVQTPDVRVNVFAALPLVHVVPAGESDGRLIHHFRDLHDRVRPVVFKGGAVARMPLRPDAEVVDAQEVRMYMFPAHVAVAHEHVDLDAFRGRGTSGRGAGRDVDHVRAVVVAAEAGRKVVVRLRVQPGGAHHCGVGAGAVVAPPAGIPLGLTRRGHAFQTQTSYGVDVQAGVEEPSTLDFGG
eukprot:scaffold302_cov247-Pinguiococcus_pyrenoidosus.AAC.29